MAIERTHQFSKWRPQSLLSACLRYAIFHLSNGKPLEEVANTATRYFIASAKVQGLDVYGVDTYTLSMDYCAILKNILEFLSRIPLLSLREISPISLSPSVSWQFLSQRDEGGTLHRWKFVDYIDEDASADLHSWEVFGDIAAADAPMELHIIAIGQRRGLHQHTPWCRIYAHPKLANVFRFQKKSGSNLEGEWKPVWFSASSSNSSKSWVDMMLKDNAIEGLIKHISIKEVSSEHQDLFLHDVLAEAEAMAKTQRMNPRNIPMSRYACDNPYTCPHQLYCYNTKLILDNVGIYKPKEGTQDAKLEQVV